MDNGSVSLGDKRQEHEADNSFSSYFEIIHVGAISQLTIRLHGVVLS
jgi:hypothetical protein